MIQPTGFAGRKVEFSGMVIGLSIRREQGVDPLVAQKERGQRIQELVRTRISGNIRRGTVAYHAGSYSARR